jgi:hypothetical protein
MVNGIGFILLALVTAVPAIAQQPKDVKQLCQDLVPYQPSDDVAYKPGVDVNGNDVAPADLDTGVQPLKLPEETQILITVDQAQKLGLTNNLPYKPEAFIGSVTVNKKGDVYFNGQRISQPQLQILCQEEKK